MSCSPGTHNEMAMGGEVLINLTKKFEISTMLSGTKKRDMAL